MAKENPAILVTREGSVDIVRFGLTRITELRDVTALETKLKALAEASESPRVLVDFRSVEFIPSAVLGVLVAEHERLQSRGGRMGVCGLNKYLTDVMRVVGLHRLLAIYPDAAEALKAMA